MAMLFLELLALYGIYIFNSLGRVAQRRLAFLLALLLRPLSWCATDYIWASIRVHGSGFMSTNRTT